MSSFKNYARGCKECVARVDRAIYSGATLTKEEKLDYYFKTLLVYREELKQFLISPTYRLAEFYSKVFSEIKKVDKYGYSNDTAVDCLRRINRWSMLCLGIRSSYVGGEDEDGVLYISVDNLQDSAYECVYSVTNRASLIDTIVDFSQYLVDNCSRDYGSFAETYMNRVLNEVNSGESPVPYLNMSEQKTLSFALSKNAITSKVTYLKIREGDSYERNDRDVHRGRQYGDGLRGTI